MAVDGVESIFIFPKIIDHDRMHEGITMIRFGYGNRWERKLRDYPISAGFFENGKCFGESETLNLKSRGAVDTALITGAST
jgi:hypothetical protein